MTNRIPLRDPGGQGPLVAEGRPDLEGDRSPNAKWRYTSDHYFEALGVGLVEGRLFDSRDTEDATQVAVVGRDLAEFLWPGESALGKRVKLRMQYEDWMTVIGVVEGGKSRLG